MYSYEGHGLSVSTRGQKVHKLAGGIRAHKVCLQGRGTTGTGVLRQYLKPYLGVLWLTLPRSGEWLSAIFALDRSRTL